MLSQQRIEQLAAFDGDGARVLSVYLNLEPARQLKHAFRTMFKDLGKEIRRELESNLDEDGREALQNEMKTVQAWLDDHEPDGLGLAVFSCTPRQFWQAHWLPVRVPDHVAYDPTPDVAPLLDIMDEYERYAVVLVDKRRARLFSVFMGEIEESDKLQDFVPGKHDQGGYSQANYQRHHEAHVYRHLKHVAERLNELYRSRSFDRLVLAGPDEALSELRRLLPRPLAEHLVGTVHAEIDAGSAEILEKTLVIERQAERAAEERLLGDLLETAGAGGRASLGLAPTLEALWLDDVQTLIVAEKLSAQGSECPTCGRLTEGRVATCPVCGAAMNAIHDVVHRAMAPTLTQSGTVEVVHGSVADRLRESAGGIGALLRYVASVPVRRDGVTVGSA